MSISGAPTAAQWYVIQTKPKQEERAMEHLRNQLFACYCPYHRVEKIRNGRKTVAQQPLFPGYIFIHLSKLTDNWHSIRSTRGVARMITFADEPLAVPEEVIEHLRTQLEQQGDEPLFKEGGKITITEGPFKDLDAIFYGTDGEKRAIILLNLLQRQQQIRISVSHLRASE